MPFNLALIAGLSGPGGINLESHLLSIRAVTIVQYRPRASPRFHTSLKVVDPQAVRHATEEGKGPVVGLQPRELRGIRVESQPGHTRVRLQNQLIRQSYQIYQILNVL